MKVDMSRIVSVGDAVKECLGKLEAAKVESEKFFSGMHKELKKQKPAKCATHGCALTIDEEKTMAISWRERKLTVSYLQCPECLAEFDTILVNEKWTIAGVPDKVLNATLESFNAESDSQRAAIAKVHSQITRQSGFLILRGSVGTGKSHLAVGVMKYMNGGLFITEADLVAELRQTYSDNSGQEEMVNKYRNAKVLVIDELTTDVKGVDIPALLYRILGYRYDKDRLTVLTSNETLNTICEILGARLKDRIRANNTVVTCEWESYRKKK